jgi:hypothetical protein
MISIKIISPPLFLENIIESQPSIPSNLPPSKKKVSNSFELTPKSANVITSSTKTFGSATTSSSIVIDKNVILASKNNIKYHENKKFLEEQIEELKNDKTSAYTQMKYYENELKYPSNNNTQLSEDNFNNYKVVLETLDNEILDREIELNNTN